MKIFFNAVVTATNEVITIISMALLFLSNDIFPVKYRGVTKEDILGGLLFAVIEAALICGLVVFIYVMMKKRKISKNIDYVAFVMWVTGIMLFIIFLCVINKFNFRIPVLVNLLELLVVGVVPYIVLIIKCHKLRKQFEV